MNDVINKMISPRGGDRREHISAAPMGLDQWGAIVTGVPFGCASLHPCLNSIAPTGLRKTTRNEGGIADMPGMSLHSAVKSPRKTVGTWYVTSRTARRCKTAGCEDVIWTPHVASLH